MLIDYGASGLEIAKTKNARRLGFPITVIHSLGRKLVVLEAAPDERTLRKWKSLHYEKLKGKRTHQRSIRLNEQWRLVFEIDKSTTPPTIKNMTVQDYH